MSKTIEEELIESLTLELRRGTLVLSVLSVLNELEEPQYGYSLVVILQEKGMNIEASTLYPLLRRLEKQEILESSWNTEGPKPRKYYTLSQRGKSIFKKLCDVWKDMIETMNIFIN